MMKATAMMQRCASDGKVTIVITQQYFHAMLLVLMTIDALQTPRGHGTCAPSLPSSGQSSLDSTKLRDRFALGHTLRQTQTRTHLSIVCFRC